MLPQADNREQEQQQLTEEIIHQRIPGLHLHKDRHTQGRLIQKVQRLSSQDVHLLTLRAVLPAGQRIPVLLPVHRTEAVLIQDHRELPVLQDHRLPTRDQAAVQVLIAAQTAAIRAQAAVVLPDHQVVAIQDRAVAVVLPDHRVAAIPDPVVVHHLLAGLIQVPADQVLEVIPGPVVVHRLPAGVIQAPAVLPQGEATQDPAAQGEVLQAQVVVLLTQVLQVLLVPVHQEEELEELE